MVGLLILPSKIAAQLSPGDLMESHKHLEGMSNCTECHTFGEKISNSKCLDCHTELNSLISSNRGYHSSSKVKNKQCVDCHSDHHGRKFDAVRFDEKSFDHDLAGFKLIGAHNKVDCRACHKPENIANKKIATRKNTWLGMEKECLSCHDDFHQGTLANSCLECHDMNQFRPASKFNHNEAEFKLLGAHQKVDCKSCHALSTKNGKEFQQFSEIKFGSCANCHQDVHDGKFGTNCKQCHTETSFLQLRGNADFNHDLTGFSLVGEHKKVSCESCHKDRKFSTTFNANLCKNCHTDTHKGQFTSKNPQADCKNCHSVYKPFGYTTFTLEQHNASDFTLEGAHLATPCFSCHLKDDHWNFRNIGSDCFECHGNKHEGKISQQFYTGTNCTACHSTEAWSSIAFDHDETTFTLEGKHAATDCKKCHYSNNENNGHGEQNFLSLTNQCAQCHQNVHGTQFEIDSETDCRRCHGTSEEWRADKFNHRKTEFPLKGKHARIDCSACHKPQEFENGESRTEYKIQKFECIDCHL